MISLNFYRSASFPSRGDLTRVLAFMTIVFFVEPIHVYSVLCQFPEDNTSRNTIYDQEMSYSQTVKPPQTTHNVAH